MAAGSAIMSTRISLIPFAKVQKKRDAILSTRAAMHLLLSFLFSLPMTRLVSSRQATERRERLAIDLM